MKSNNYYKSYNVQCSLYSNTYNKYNNYHNSSNIVTNQKYSKKNPHTHPQYYNQKRNSYKKQHSNYNCSLKDNIKNYCNNQRKQDYDYSIYSNNIYYEEEFQRKNVKNHIQKRKKESIDIEDESTFCLSHNSFNSHEYNDNFNLENSIKDNKNVINESIIYEYNKKNSENNDNLHYEKSNFLNDKLNDTNIKNESNINLLNNNLIANPECSNKINLNQKNNNKISNNKFNKFNIHNNNLNQNQIAHFENTEILKVNIKISKDTIAVFKLRRYDDLFNTIKLFCEINCIKEELMKPIIIKTLEALNNIYRIYNSKLSQKDINQLNLIHKVQNQI